MKIALISYEYPPETAISDIGMCVWQIAQTLVQRGHQIEVFAGSHQKNSKIQNNGVIIHRVKVLKQEQFSQALLPIFKQRHAEIEFDVLESPEIGAEAEHIIRAHPDLPLVVKLYTPSFMIAALNHVSPSIYLKIRRFAGALRRLQKPKPFRRNSYDLETDPERRLALDADEIATPSTALGDYLIEEWTLDPNKVFPLANPYFASPSLLKIPFETQSKVISFIGPLELRQGVIELAKAVPSILHYFPHTKFRFIGADIPMATSQVSCQEYLEFLLEDVLEAVEFTGEILWETIPHYLAQTDICVFPSHWENFPSSCLAAMAAGRGIIGSSAGGMVEMLNHGEAGLLIPPHDSQAITEAIIELLSNPKKRVALGRQARKRLLTTYNVEHLGKRLEESYIRAIQRRQNLGPRYSFTKKVYFQA